MCGIAGFLGRFNASLLDAMNHAIHHRGPDDAGTLFIAEKGLGFCHRRLSIIDLSPMGHQPMWDVSKTVVIVFNGEIYNYRELREELTAAGFVFKSQTDTEVLLNLYLKDGERMLEKLNGMFAFGLWDTRDSSLLLARDGFGVKPLYYTTTPLGTLFASEMKAILQEPSVEQTLNPFTVVNHLTYLYSLAPNTMLSSIHKLRPGHALRVKAGKIEREWCYYDLPCSENDENYTVESAITELRDRLQTAVQRQMVADVEVGAFLSGGLDSSAIVAFAKKFSHAKTLPCFTIGFNDDAWAKEGMTADLAYAQRVSRELNVDLHTITVGPEMVSDLQTMIYHQDEPQADLAALHVLSICRLAREQGIKVLLSGTGSDDIFSGYRRHTALLSEKYWSWLPHPVLSAFSSMAYRMNVDTPLKRRFAKVFQYANLSKNNRTAAYFNWIHPLTRNSILSSDVRYQIADNFTFDPMLDTLESLPSHMSDLDKMLYLEGKYFLADHNLNYTDKMSMAAGVEVRVPFLDPDLVQFASRLPMRLKHRGGKGKWIFRKAMESVLPHDVIYRPKTGFGAPLRVWLKTHLKPLVQEYLNDESIRHRGLFDAAGVRNLIKLDNENRVDGSYTIFSMLCIELWCRQFLAPVTRKNDVSESRSQGMRI